MNIDIFNCVGHASSDTHRLQPYEKMYSYARRAAGTQGWQLEIVDPFARKCMWGNKRNDINPDFLYDYTTHCMDALDFMFALPRSSADIVLIDPPFSDRQSNEEYGTSNLYTNPRYIADLGEEAFRILKPAGYLVKCGYNTNPPAKGFELVKVAICQMGACRNDILISLWQKVQMSLNVGLQ